MDEIAHLNIENHKQAIVIQEQASRIREMERDLTTLSRLCDLLRKEESEKHTELEDAQTKIGDLTSELVALQEFYLVQMPDSLTALMELEERIG